MQERINRYSKKVSPQELLNLRYGLLDLFMESMMKGDRYLELQRSDFVEGAGEEFEFFKAVLDEFYQDREKNKHY
jgi:hypothetical protein